MSDTGSLSAPAVLNIAGATRSATNYAQTPVTVPARSISTFAELIKLPLIELKARLEQDGVKSEELRALCKYLGLLQSGSKVVMIGKIIEKLSDEDIVPKSPEGRGVGNAQFVPVQLLQFSGRKPIKMQNRRTMNWKMILSPIQPWDGRAHCQRRYRLAFPVSRWQCSTPCS